VDVLPSLPSGGVYQDRKGRLTAALDPQNRLARGLGVPPRRINEIIHGRRRITADTALRLAKYFRMSPEFGLGLQMDYELDLETDRLGDALEREVGEYSRAS
jgi:addiction module HigA family antidote